MSIIIEILGILFIAGTLFWFELSKYLAVTIMAATLALFSWFASALLMTVAWAIFLSCSAFIFVKPLRIKFITSPIMQYMKKVLPPMSETERVALEAGDVWHEAKLFQGKPDFKAIHGLRKPSYSEKETAFLNNETETLCAMIDDWQSMREGDLSPAVWQYIKENGFLGLIIPENYGGKGFSALAHSTIVTKIASRSISAAVTVMVPNSLGPAELLLHYGTEEQKKHYLPNLASGKDIPCFALTAPNAGSDAGALCDSGIVVEEKTKAGTKLCIRLSWDKRYITLAPIATVLGVAFKLYDPDNLLGLNKKKIGITLALIPTSHPGVEIGARHSPLGLAFLNGTTRGKDVLIPLDWVIGGKEMAGVGWKMLMESLSIGRSISLPALATATAKLAYRTTGAYASLRKQFRLSIGQFEGVEEALARIGGKTYLMEAVRLMTADAVAQGVRPSLVSAITKYHLTELARSVMDDAMDVHAGRAIQFGPRNYLGIHYTALPMSITVEGANILTRNLIIFGQGAVRCHPFVQQEMVAASEKDKKVSLNVFDKLLLKHIAYTLTNFIKCISYSLSAGKLIKSPKKDFSADYYRQIKRMSVALSLVSDVSMALLGGELKRKERLSARLGDVLSYLYMACAVLKYYEDFGAKKEEDGASVHWALGYCFSSIQIAFDDFFQNFPNKIIGKTLKRLVFPWGRAYMPPSDVLSKKVAKQMLTPSAFRDRLTAFCYVGKGNDCSTGRLEQAFTKVEAIKILENTIACAIKEGRVKKEATFQEQLQMALELNILSEREVRQLSEADNARTDAMDVDEFSFDELTTREN